MNFWIMERHNPQLGLFYVPMGKLTVKQAKANERPLYGHNVMHRFATEAEYRAKVAQLKKEGANVH